MTDNNEVPNETDVIISAIRNEIKSLPCQVKTHTERRPITVEDSDRRQYTTISYDRPKEPVSAKCIIIAIIFAVIGFFVGLRVGSPVTKIVNDSGAIRVLEEIRANPDAYGCLREYQDSIDEVLDETVTD